GQYPLLEGRGTRRKRRVSNYHLADHLITSLFSIFTTFEVASWRWNPNPTEFHYLKLIVTGNCRKAFDFASIGQSFDSLQKFAGEGQRGMNSV
ncbi:MAG: hypothetical protein WCE52_20680, partial [Candidatus Acidiferrum sp.]